MKKVDAGTLAYSRHMSRERCETCSFYMPEPNRSSPPLDLTDVTLLADPGWKFPRGCCLRFPPTPRGLLKVRSGSPVVFGIQWCGEWRDAETHPAVAVEAMRPLSKLQR